MEPNPELDFLLELQNSLVNQLETVETRIESLIGKSAIVAAMNEPVKLNKAERVLRLVSSHPDSAS